MKSIAASSAALLLASSFVRADTANAEKVQALRLAPTEVDRLNLLEDNQVLIPTHFLIPSAKNHQQFVFDFLNPPSGVVTGAGGHTVEASSANFAAVIGNGVAMTIGFLG